MAAGFAAAAFGAAAAAAGLAAGAALGPPFPVGAAPFAESAAASPTAVASAPLVGGAMVAANLARHLQGPLADRPIKWRPLVYCWRGGLRSGSMVAWLRLVGWDAQQLVDEIQADLTER